MGKRLKQELDDRGISPTQLCSMVPDLDIGTLSAIYKRDSRNSKFAPEIAVALGLNLHWLLTGDGDKAAHRGTPSVSALETDLSADGRDVYTVGKGRPIPVIGNGNGGHLPERVWDDQGYPVGYSDEYSEIATSDQHAFIVRVRGDSMWPKYTPGEYALVEPDTTPDVGDDILVRLATGETLIKTLAARSPDGVRLSSYNNTEVRFYANHEITWMYWVPFPIPAKKIKTRS